MSELTALQNAYIEAEKNNQEWLMQSMAKVFEDLLFQAFLRHYTGSGIDLIMPVPLNKKKLRERGFNQAFLLIRNFATYYQKKFGQTPLWKIDITSLDRAA